MTEILGGIVAVVLAIAGTVTGIGWIAKRLVTSAIAQNKAWVDGALENMKANTSAINANTAATQALATAIDHDRVVRDERDKSVNRALDRIERRLS